MTREQYEILLPIIKEHCVPEKFYDSTIYNIYYDTPDFRIIRESIDKPAYKEKLRLRSYSIPDADTEVFTELKKKAKGIVYKRRESMRYADAVAYLNGNVAPPKRTQIIREIDYFKYFYRDIAPAMFIYYHRLAFLEPTGSELRITFDDDITARTYDLDITKGVYGKKMLDEGVRLMEVKIGLSMPLWLTNALDKIKIYPCSYSKYGTAYNDELKRLITEKKNISIGGKK